MQNTWFGLPHELAVGLVMLLVLTMYAIFAGADFGGGILDLVSFGPRRKEQQQAISQAMGPVWEANHVWLIFMVVILFTAFPRAFEALSIKFFLPFHLVLVGIVLRGASFVFRANADVASFQWTAWARVFGIASVITPFLLGSALGAVSVGGSVLHPVSLGIGALTLAACAYQAAVFLTVETEGELQEDFRFHAMGAGVTVAVFAALMLPLIRGASPLLWEHLSNPASVPPMIAGAVLAAGSFWAVSIRRYQLARVLAVGEIVIVLWGWAFAQWPYIIYPGYTVYNSAAPGPAIKFLLDTLPFGLALLIPSLVLLFVVFKGRRRPTA
ncbi:MAG TPA: cytochrome d ubiquinol oxidase subunit II [Symbiobacteriaceae bacterium]|nr:cytochrome d ubiquinol oxidase subunit II [Symbiobacteriaceae bacterium]